MSDNAALDGPSAAVSCAVVRGSRVLLVQRGQEPELGRWAFPGGRVEKGETPEVAAARELQEEASIAAEICEPLGQRMVPALAGRPPMQLTFFLARWISGDGIAGDDAADVRWVSAGDAEHLPLATGMAEAFVILAPYLES